MGSVHACQKGRGKKEKKYRECENDGQYVDWAGCFRKLQCEIFSLITRLYTQLQASSQVHFSVITCVFTDKLTSVTVTELSLLFFSNGSACASKLLAYILNSAQN